MMLGLLFVPSPALACGGMFCDSIAPVDQAAERIVFHWEPDDAGGGGTITTEVQITYAGEADDFAWVVPVAGEPELFVSNDAIFNQLANNSIPTHQLVAEQFGTCEMNFGMQEFAMAADSASSEDGGVSVVATQTVGPYETVVLQADSSDQLVEWLQVQGYGIPDTFEPAVRPYIAGGQYFVALKLASDKSTGDLAPLGMRYRGNAASIPIQLTAIAAQPDMPIQVFVMGPSRAVPDNYLHVQINEAAIDWYAGGTNYRDVVKRAVDEAGGLAFVTDYSGSDLGIQFWNDGWISLSSLRQTEDPIQWLEQIVFSGMPPSSQLTALLTRLVPPPDGVDAATFLSCPGCYDVDMEDWDPEVATDALEVEIVDVLRDAQERLDGSAHITRLFTTMDAAEMTADPLFVFNADIEQELGSSHTATNEIHCGLFEGDNAERTLVLADGREIELPSEDWLADRGMTELEYMEELTSPAAIVIEDLGSEGEGTMLFDYREQAFADAEAFNKENGGCGCASGGSAPTLAGLLGLAAFARRRRTA